MKIKGQIPIKNYTLLLLMNFTDMDEKLCRFCYLDRDPHSNKNDLISPCDCKGSLKYVHSSCLMAWRFKGNFFGETKHCETCKSSYNIPNERTAHKIIVGLCVITIMLTCFIISTYFLNSFFHGFGMVLKEILNDSFDIEYSLDHGFKDSFNYYISCLMVLITFYKLYSDSRLLSIFNYIFTFWRIVQFDFLADKILFTLFSLFFIRDIFNNLFVKIDRFFFYMINSQITQKAWLNV